MTEELPQDVWHRPLACAIADPRRCNLSVGNPSKNRFLTVAALLEGFFLYGRGSVVEMEKRNR